MDINKKIAKIYLHPGMTKTATTSILATLYDTKNKELLLKNDLCFPSHCEQHRFVINTFSKNAYRHIFNMQKDGDEKSKENGIIQYKEIFEKEIKDCCATKVIISAEGIGGLTESELLKFKKYLTRLMPNAKIVMLLCIREFYNWTGTSIQQGMRSRGMNLEEYIKNRYLSFDTTKVFEGYIHVFGKKKIVAYKFEDACVHQYGPVGYFLNLVGVENKDMIKFIIHKRNIGFSGNVILMINYINTTIPLVQNNKINVLRDRKDTKILSQITGKKYRIDKTSLDKLKSIINKENKFVNENFGLDYTEIAKEYQPRNSIFYEESYYSDLIKIFSQLEDIIKKLVFDYHNIMIRKVSKKNGKDILVKANKYIKENFPTIIHMKLPKTEKKSQTFQLATKACTKAKKLFKS